jgi:hypothetical protein
MLFGCKRSISTLERDTIGVDFDIEDYTKRGMFGLFGEEFYNHYPREIRKKESLTQIDYSIRLQVNTMRELSEIIGYVKQMRDSDDIKQRAELYHAIKEQLS